MSIEIPKSGAQEDREGPCEEGDEVTLEDFYQMDPEPIGLGSTASVYEATSKTTGERVAIKILFKDLVDYESMNMEIAILAKLHHPNIIRLYEVFETDSQVILVLQLCSGGTLLPYVLENEGEGEREAARIVREILKGVAFLHASGVVHRDIKPENVLFLHKGRNSPIVLADFGYSKEFFRGMRPMSTLVGTWAFVAPEVIRVVDGTSGYDASCDIWSVGALTYMLLTGNIPFTGALDNENMTEERIQALYEQEMNVDISFFEHQPSQLAIDFIFTLLNPYPNERPTAEEALKHPWLANPGTIKCPSLRTKLEDVLKGREAVRHMERARKCSVSCENLRVSKIHHEKALSTSVGCLRDYVLSMQGSFSDLNRTWSFGRLMKEQQQEPSDSCGIKCDE